MKHLSNDHDDHPNEHENSHKLCNETGHPVLGLLQSHWKLRQQHDQNFSMEGKVIVRQTLLSEEKINPKEQDCESHCQRSEYKS